VFLGGQYDNKGCQRRTEVEVDPDAAAAEDPNPKRTTRSSVSNGKRGQQDNADGATSGHQPKRPRPIPRQTSLNDTQADTLEADTFNRASTRAPVADERAPAVNGEGALAANGESAPRIRACILDRAYWQLTQPKI
jgi:hypothetical protein